MTTVMARLKMLMMLLSPVASEVCDGQGDDDDDADDDAHQCDIGDVDDG